MVQPKWHQELSCNLHVTLFGRLFRLVWCGTAAGLPQQFVWIFLSKCLDLWRNVSLWCGKLLRTLLLSYHQVAFQSKKSVALRTLKVEISSRIRGEKPTNDENCPPCSRITFLGQPALCTTKLQNLGQPVIVRCITSSKHDLLHNEIETWEC